MTDANGEVRVLFATVAFGMGVDAKAVHTVIHFSLSQSEECYFQESGRAGRDGMQSYAILVHHPQWRAGRVKVDPTMKSYASPALTVCRRQYLLDVFCVKTRVPLNDMHLCCDVCAVKCECGGDTCADPDYGKGIAELRMHEVAVAANRKAKKLVNIRDVGDEHRQALRDQLTVYRDSLLVEHGSLASALYTGGDVASAFPMEYIYGIVNDASKIADIEQLQQFYPLFNQEHKIHVWKMFTDTIIMNASHQSHDLLPVDLSQLTLSSASSSGSEDTSDEESDVVRGVIASDSSTTSSHSSAKSGSSDSEQFDLESLDA
jgi:hypothetical protein